MTVRFLDEAAAELASAVAGYEAKSQGLGVNFAVAIRDGLARIEAYPKAWQLIGERVRRYRLNRFPYGLVYAEVGSDIVILALMHLHRKPGYWKERLTQIFLRADSAAMLIATRIHGTLEFATDSRVLWADPDCPDELGLQLRAAAGRGRVRFACDMGPFTLARAAAAMEAFYRSVLSRR